MNNWAASWQNQQNYCAKRRQITLASTQCDQSLRCQHEETFGPQLLTERTAKTLIRLGGCPGWSEFSLGTQVILLLLSWGGSNMLYSVSKKTLYRLFMQFSGTTANYIIECNNSLLPLFLHKYCLAYIQGRGGKWLRSTYLLWRFSKGPSL